MRDAGPPEGMGQTLLGGELADERPPPGARSRDRERCSHGRLADAALAGDEDQTPVEQRFEAHLDVEADRHAADERHLMGRVGQPAARR